MHGRRVVITGLGVVTPSGNNLDEFWSNIVQGKSSAGPIKSFNVSKFDTRFACMVKNFDPSKYIGPKELKRMDPFVRFAVVAAKMALEDAHLEVNKVDSNRVGVLVGSGIGGITTVEEQHLIMLKKGPSRMSPFLIPMLIVNMAPGQISIQTGARGPNSCIATACATSAHAVGEAARLILHGDADAMIAGGAEAAITNLGLGGFCAMHALSTRNDDPLRASRPFDRQRDGFVMGEGAGILILEELEHAKKRGARIYAELIGYGLTGDAYHMTAPAPDGEGATRCMKMALEDAEINPLDVDYINAHGTSTALNDKLETQAIKQVFKESAKKVPISSTKSMTGHLLGAAGSVELIVCSLVIRDGVIPPTINYQYPDPDCDLDYVPNQARKAKVNIALSNSLGFGGHNATLIIKRFEK
ncbi:MAG: beta-ketoacyl-ACP synthase II [Chlamydiae bacterium]|nr:beta-ketoacyl-ACP synthase II [Chlamydiota bacterium]MBI3278139.1 beta-ketoacyl-ACP synthase II [Chlamydiota bacterium]